MAIKYGFFDSIAGDRKYTADDIGRYLMGIVSSGVYADKSTSLQVLSNDGMSVEVQPGRAMLNYHYMENDDMLTLTLDRGGTQDRVDAIVARLDLNNRLCEIVVKKGTEAAKPSAPVMDRTDVVKEYMLASVHVPKLATSITQSSITDTRADNTVCGWVTGVIDQVDTSTLFTQWQVAYEEAYEEMGDYTKAQKAAWEAFLQNVDENLDDYTEEQKAAWEAFFQNIQDDILLPVPTVGDSGKAIVVNEAGNAFIFGDTQANIPITSEVPTKAEIWLDPDEEPNTITCAQIGAVPVSRTINGKALSSNIVLTAEDLGISIPENTDWECSYNTNVTQDRNNSSGSSGTYVGYVKYGKLVIVDFLFFPTSSARQKTNTELRFAYGFPMPRENAGYKESGWFSATQYANQRSYASRVDEGELIIDVGGTALADSSVYGTIVYIAKD